ncbi:hypothetical protein B0H11DRAFT_2421025 [Mycena galericulata]|nr:hypothetical protein B0H11DRAFT_2421025 [Mycena galericulata]
MLPTFTSPVDLAVEATANTTSSIDVPKQHNDPVADIDWVALATHLNSCESFLPFQNASTTLTDEIPLFGFAGQDGTGGHTSLSDAPHSNAGQSIITPEFHLLDQQDFGLDLESLLPPALLHDQVPESFTDNQQEFRSHTPLTAFSTPPLVSPEATADYMDGGNFSATSSSCGIGCTESVPEQSTTYGTFAPLHTLASNLAAPQDVYGPGFAFDSVSSEFPNLNITSYFPSVFMLPPANKMSSGHEFDATLDPKDSGYPMPPTLSPPASISGSTSPYWDSMRLPQFTPPGSSTASPAPYYTPPQPGWAPDSSPVAGLSSSPATARQGRATKARKEKRHGQRHDPTWNIKVEALNVSRPYSPCAVDADQVKKILEEAAKAFKNENPSVVCKWIACTETVAMGSYRDHLRRAHGVNKGPVSCAWSGPCTLNAPIDAGSVVKHIKSVHLGLKLRCTVCNRFFSRRDSLKRHLEGRPESDSA